MNGNNDDQGRSNHPQHLVAEAIQQAAQLHAAQMMHQFMPPQSMGNVQYVYQPTVIPLPNGGAYSIIQPGLQHNMGLTHSLGLPPGGQLMAAYSNGATYHLTPALLNAHTSLFQQPCSIPSMIPQATQKQPPMMHQQQPQPTVALPLTPRLQPIVSMPPKPPRRKEYRDYAKDPESNQPPKRQRSNKDQTFPMILYRILSNSECKDYISWLPHGRGFKIHKPEQLEENVLPLYFRHTKLASFMRQVNGWGYQRMPTGRDRNSYYHEMFLRGFPYLCAKMRRPVHKLKSSSEPKTHPNFYDSKALVVLPNEERVVTSESTSPTNISSDTPGDTDGSGSDQAMFRRGGSSALDRDMYGIMSNLCNSSNSNSGGEDSSRLGGNLSVAGSDGLYASGASEQGSDSPRGGHTSDGIASFDPCVAYASLSSRPSDSGEGGTTSDSSGGRKGGSEPSSQSNGKQSSDTPSSNGNSSDGSGSYLHLLTDTALRAAALSTHHHQQGGAPAFVGGYAGARDNISILGSDAGTEPISDASVSRWPSPRKRAHARLVLARKTSNTANTQQEGESSDGSSSDDRGGR